MAPAWLTRFLCCAHKAIFTPVICCLIGKRSRTAVFYGTTGLNFCFDLLLASSSVPPLFLLPPHQDLFWAHQHDITLLPPQGSQQ